MLQLLLSTFALGSASLGAFAGVRAISNIDKTKKNFKNQEKLYDAAFQTFNDELNLTKNLAENYIKLRCEVLYIIERLVKVLKHNNVNVNSSESSLQPFPEFAEMLANNVDSGAEYESVMNLTNSLKTAVKEVIYQKITAQKNYTLTLNLVNNGAISLTGGGVFIGSLLASGQIAVSPVVLISGFLIKRELDKAVTKVSEYEGEVNTAIAKIHSTTNYMQQLRQKITDCISNLQSLHESIDELINSHQLAIFVREKPQEAAAWLPYLISLVDCNGIAENVQNLMPAIEFFINTLTEKILDTEGKLNHTNVPIKENYRNPFLVGVDEIAAINIEQYLIAV
ncbi:hypothetical protein NIES2100_54810 [Calothrix sp. NIES-2100]|uniref:hypothetical protein n=1 Tax=Calothrix sp. NIES-2100 TaxID=1954172 RepID=UPI000B607386|nr:hypothetical protein NIES2100_54810 [Calothrix sp. NIES-2100]